MDDIRWKQRFENFEKAFSKLGESLKIPNPSETERAGLIQFFEMTLELSWKLMKDYLEEQGFKVNSPKGAIKEAFRADIIQDGHVWIDALDRNLTVHTYDEETAILIESRIREFYFPAIEKLYKYFKKL